MSYSWAATMVVGLAVVWKKSAWWDERVATKQEQIEGYESDSCSHWENLATAEEKEADINIACDGESTLHHCLKLWASNPPAKHFDPIQATQATLHAILITWLWEHV